MSYHVRLKPSGHQFEIQSKDNILDAGLREGLNLGHNCMNGSCGQCHARLLSGDIEQYRHHDYVLGEQQKLDGQFLTCCHRAKSDLMLEIHELHDSREIPYQEIDVKLARLERLKDDVMQLDLRSPRSRVLEFLAGQRVKICIADENCKELGIASCPCNGLNLRFHVMLGEDEFSQAVFSQLKKGACLKVTGPYGAFTLNEDSTRPMIFIAWESGFAQVMSILEHTISINPDRQIALYWLSATPQGHYLSNYCRAWRDVLDNFSFEKIILSPSGSDSLHSEIQALLLQKNHLNNFDIYAVMPEQQLVWLKEMLAAQDFPAEQLVVDLLDTD